MRRLSSRGAWLTVRTKTRFGLIWGCCQASAPDGAGTVLLRADAADALEGDPGRFGDQAAGEGHIDVAGDDSIEELGQPHPLQFDSYSWCFGGEQTEQVRGEHWGSGSPSACAGCPAVRPSW